jgi:hypothetical protein
MFFFATFRLYFYIFQSRFLHLTTLVFDSECSDPLTSLIVAATRTFKRHWTGEIYRFWYRLATTSNFCVPDCRASFPTTQRKSSPPSTPPSATPDYTSTSLPIYIIPSFKIIIMPPPLHQVIKSSPSDLSKNLGHPAKTFHFFKLPPELRLRVYRALFVVEELSVGNGWPRIRKGPINKVQISTGLMRTCSRAYAETHEVLYGENKFSFCSADGTELFFKVTRAGRAIHHVTIRRMFASLAFSHHPEHITHMTHIFEPLTTLRTLKFHFEHWAWIEEILFDPENNPALADGTYLRDAIAPDEAFVDSFLKRMAMKGVTVVIDLSIMRYNDYDMYRSQKIEKLPLPQDYRYQISALRSLARPEEDECKAVLLGWLTKNKAKGIYEDEFSDLDEWSGPDRCRGKLE